MARAATAVDNSAHYAMPINGIKAQSLNPYSNNNSVKVNLQTMSKSPGSLKNSSSSSLVPITIQE